MRSGKTGRGQAKAEIAWSRDASSREFSRYHVKERKLLLYYDDDEDNLLDALQQSSACKVSLNIDLKDMSKIIPII